MSRETYRKLDTIKENLAVVASQTDVGKDKVKRAISDKGVIVEAPVGANPTFEALAKGVASIKQTGTINVNSLKESTAILSEDVEAGDLLEGYNRVPSPTITGVDNMFEMSKFMNLKLSDADYSTPMMMPMYRELTGNPINRIGSTGTAEMADAKNNGNIPYPTDLDLEKSVDFVTAYDGKYLLYIIHHSHTDDVSEYRGSYKRGDSYMEQANELVKSTLGLPKMRPVSIHTYVRLDGEYIYDPDKSLFNIGLAGYGNLYESICPLNGVNYYNNSKPNFRGEGVLVKPIGESGRFFSIMQGVTSESRVYPKTVHGFGILRFNEDGTWELVYDGGTNTVKPGIAEWAKSTGKFYDPLVIDFSKVDIRNTPAIQDIRVCLSEEGQTGKLVVLTKVISKVKGIVSNEANFQEVAGYTVFTYNVDMLDTQFNMVPVADNPFFIKYGLQQGNLYDSDSPCTFYHSCLSHKEQWIKYIGTGTKASPEGEYIILDSSMISPRYAANSCSMANYQSEIWWFDRVIPFILFRHKGNNYFELMCLMGGTADFVTNPGGTTRPTPTEGTKLGLGQHLQYGACLNWGLAPYGNISTMVLNGGKPYTKFNPQASGGWVSWKMDVAYAYLGDKFLSQMCWWFYSLEYPEVSDTPSVNDTTRTALWGFGVRTPGIVPVDSLNQKSRFVNYYYKIEIIENVDKDKEVVCLLQYTKPSRNFGSVMVGYPEIYSPPISPIGTEGYYLSEYGITSPKLSFYTNPRNIVVATWKLNVTSGVDLLTHLTARSINLPSTGDPYFRKQAYLWDEGVMSNDSIKDNEIVVLQNVDLLGSSHYIDVSNLHHISIIYSYSSIPHIGSVGGFYNIKALPPVRSDIVWEDKGGVPTLFPNVPKATSIDLAPIPIIGTLPSLYQGNQGEFQLLDPLIATGGLNIFSPKVQNHQYYMFLVRKDIVIQLVCSNPPDSNLMVSPFKLFNGFRVLNNCGGISPYPTVPPRPERGGVEISMNQIAKLVFYRNINYKKLGTPPLYHMFKEGAKLEFSPQPPFELGLDSCEDPNSKLFKYAQDLDNTAIIQKLNEKYLVTLNRTTKTISIYGLKTDSHGLPTYTKLSSTYTIEFSTLGSLDWETNFTITEVDVDGVFYIGYIQSDMPTILKVVNGEILPTPITIRPTNILPVICIALGKDAKTVVISLNQAPYASAFYDVSAGTSWVGRNYFKVDITDIPSYITPVLKYTPDYQYLISCNSSPIVVRDNGNGTFTKIPHIGSTREFKNALPTQTMPLVVAIGSNIRVIKEKGATYYEFVLFNRDYRELLKANNNNCANLYSRPNGGGFTLYSIQKMGAVERVYYTMEYSSSTNEHILPNFNGLIPEVRLNVDWGPPVTGTWVRPIILRGKGSESLSWANIGGVGNKGILNNMVFRGYDCRSSLGSISKGASYCGYMGGIAIVSTTSISTNPPSSWRRFNKSRNRPSVTPPGILAIGSPITPASPDEQEDFRMGLAMGYGYTEIRDIGILENGDIYILGNIPISLSNILSSNQYSRLFYDNCGMVTHLTRKMVGYGNIVTSNKQRSKYLHEPPLSDTPTDPHFEGYSQVETLVIKSKLDLALTYTFNSGGNNIRLHTNRASLIIGDYCCNTVSIKAKKTNNLLNIIGYLNPFGFNTVDEGLYSTNRGGPDPTGKSLLTQQSSNSWNKPDYILIAKEKGKVGDVVNCEILLDTNK